MVLRQATRWPRLFLVGKRRFSNWSGRRRWTQEWCFEPVRQNVAVKRRPSSAQKGRGMITIPVITERCAGIDVGKRGLAAAVAVGPADKEAEIKTRWFGTTVPALHDLHAWLREEGCTTVAMESTGSYWIPVKNILEQDLRITLVCPRKHHPKKGEKTDFRDAIDLAVHHRHGLLTGSYMPERGVVESAEQMAEMAKKRLRQKIPQLTEALEGQQMNDHHRWLIEQSVEHAKFLDRQVEELEKKIDLQLEPYRGQYELLMTIPGIKEAAAFNILAEIGPKMQQFPTADQLCSWAGICPGNNRSAGKSKSSHIKKANKFLLAALVESSWGAARQEGSVFQRKFRRWVKKGEKKAVIAVCRCLLRVIWSVLRNDRPYVEPDAKVLQHLERQKQVRYHTQRLRELGADDQTIKTLLDNLMDAPLPTEFDAGAVAAQSKEPDPARSRCSPNQKKSDASGRRPIARGVLGFRIRTARKKKYSVEKDPPDPPSQAAASETASPPRTGGRPRKTKT